MNICLATQTNVWQTNFKIQHQKDFFSVQVYTGLYWLFFEFSNQTINNLTTNTCKNLTKPFASVLLILALFIQFSFRIYISAYKTRKSSVQINLDTLPNPIYSKFGSQGCFLMKINSHLRIVQSIHQHRKLDFISIQIIKN